MLRFVTFPQPSRYDIHSTEISRAGMSASAYSFGLFEKRGQVGPTDFDPFFIVTNNATTDNELRFFKTCPNYISGVKKNKKGVRRRMIIVSLSK